jgi:Cu/Ag efflux protein CusF
MIVKTLAIAIALTVPTAAQGWAQQPVTKKASVTATATIQAIDTTKRTMTLRDEQGQEDTYVVDPTITRFNELKVGDTVKMTYTESVVLQVRKPGETKPPAEATSKATLSKAPTSELPGATIAAEDKMTVTVKAIDPATPSVTVTTPDGRTVTRKVEDKKNLSGVKVGDQIDITYVRALVTNIERGK